MLEIYDCAANPATAARLWQLTQEASIFRCPHPVE